MRFILALIFCAFAQQANCSLTENSSGLAIYKKILGCPEVTLACLKAKGLITQVAPLVYSIEGADEAYFHELETTIRLSSLLNLPVVFCPQLPGYGGVPAVDVIVYNHDGKPIANVSLKTKKQQSRNLTKSIKGLLQDTRNSIREIYNRRAFYSIFSVDQAPKKPNETHEQYQARKLRPLIADATLKLLGIEGNRARPIWIAIDIRQDRSKSIEVHDSRSRQFQIARHRKYLAIRDDKSNALIHAEHLIDLDALQSRLASDNDASQFIMMVNETFLRVQPGSIQRGTFKVFQDVCASFLNIYELESIGE